MDIRNRVLRLVTVPASSIRPSPHNWRTHPTAQHDALKGILAEMGFAGAILVREYKPKKYEAIDGHLRLEEMGDQPVPCLVTDLTAAEARKLMAVFDPLGSMAGADAGKLKELLAGITTDNDALQAMLDQLAAANGLGVPVPGGGGDEFDGTPAKGPTRTKLGQIWEIGGKHRLAVGDCTDPETVGRLMAGEKAGLCFTSPPYAQQRDYGAKIADWDALMQGAFGCLPMADDGQVLVNLGLIHREGEWVPYWDAWIEWMRSKGWRRFGWYVWDQGPGLPGDWNGRMAPSHEFVFHFNRQSIKPVKTTPCKGAGQPEHGHGIREADGSVQPWTHTGRVIQSHRVPDSVCRAPRGCADKEGKGHPAKFSLAFATYFVQSWLGHVYDPFLGSGTALIAAHRLNRTAYGCEIEPRYADLILKRCEAEGMDCLLASPVPSPLRANSQKTTPRRKARNSKTDT